MMLEDESAGNSTDRSGSELNTPKLNPKPEVLPTTAVSTQGQHRGNYYYQHPIPALGSLPLGIHVDGHTPEINKQITFGGPLNTGNAETPTSFNLPSFHFKGSITKLMATVRSVRNRGERVETIYRIK